MSCFICYRTEQVADLAGRLYESLRRRTRRVFMDQSDMRVGEDFPARLRDQVRTATDFLIVIGPEWAEAADDQGRRRLDNPQDYIRREILWARESGRHIVPVLVQEADMPNPERLPPELSFVTTIHAARLRVETWEHDCERVWRQLRSSKLALVARLGVLALVAIGSAIAWTVLVPRPNSNSSSPIEPGDIDKYIDWTTDTNPAKRLQGIRQLGLRWGSRHDDEIVSALVPCLEDPDFRVRRGAAEAIGAAISEPECARQTPLAKRLYGDGTTFEIGEVLMEQISLLARLHSGGDALASVHQDAVEQTKEAIRKNWECLANAYFRGTDLSWSELYKSNLRDANLQDANLEGANLFGADLQGIRNWRPDSHGKGGIRSIRFANVAEVRNAGDFRRWALENGAVEYGYDEWLDIKSRLRATSGAGLPGSGSLAGPQASALEHRKDTHKKQQGSLPAVRGHVVSSDKELASVQPRREGSETVSVAAPQEVVQKTSRIPKTAKELFGQVSQALANHPEKARELAGIYLFKISGDGGGEWTVDCASAHPSAKAGVHGTPQFTLEISNADFEAWLRDPGLGMHLYFQRKMKISGDPMMTFKLAKLFTMTP